MVMGPDHFGRSRLNCHIWPTGKMVFGQMANSQNEDKDFPEVTRTRPKRCGTLEFSQAR